jgi:sRNA-binding protein
MSSKPAGEAMHQHALKAALSKVAAASRRLRRRREQRARSAWLMETATAGPLPDAGQKAAPQPDPVRIAVLAMESLGRASMRASFTGMEVKVAVPDDATAAIFRAALSETTRTRPTDRLVRVVVD